MAAAERLKRQRIANNRFRVLQYFGRALARSAAPRRTRHISRYLRNTKISPKSRYCNDRMNPVSTLPRPSPNTSGVMESSLPQAGWGCAGTIPWQNRRAPHWRMRGAIKWCIPPGSRRSGVFPP